MPRIRGHPRGVSGPHAMDTYSRRPGCIHRVQTVLSRGAAKILAAQEDFEEIDIKVAFLWPIDRENPIDRDSTSQRSTNPSLLGVDTKEVV
jgi:hypothetical protein